METPSDSPITLPRLLTRALLTLVGVIILYVLSIGPVSIFYRGAIMTSPVLLPDREFACVLYHPLWKAADGAGLGDALGGYCGWCRRIRDHIQGGPLLIDDGQ